MSGCTCGLSFLPLDEHAADCQERLASEGIGLTVQSLREQLVCAERVLERMPDLIDDEFGAPGVGDALVRQAQEELERENAR